MLEIIKSIVEKIEKKQTNFSLWALSFVGIIAIRIFVESWVGGLTNKNADYFFHHTTYTFTFFCLSYLIFLSLLQNFFKISLVKASNILLVGYLIIIFPPLIDYLLLNDKIYLSFYGIYGLPEMLKRFLTFFGDNPDFGITYGVRIEIALTILFLFIYSLIKTKSNLRSAKLALVSYAILFFLATFPSWVTIIVKGFPFDFLKVGEVQIAQLFLTPAKFFSRSTGSYFNALSIKLSAIYSLLIVLMLLKISYQNYRRKLILFLENIRPVQVVYHLGLVIVGIGIGMKFSEVAWSFDFFNIIALLNVFVAVILAWIASVAVNDIFDREIDEISNKHRPLVSGEMSKKEYVVIGVSAWFFSVLLSAIINPKVAFLLIAYQALAWVYSAPPLRLKKIFLLSTIISSLASVVIFVAGFVLVTPSQDLTDLPTRILWLLFISLTLSLPIKDLKDIAGDKQKGAKTIPVVFGEYWGKVIIGVGIFLSYLLSVILLNEFRLFYGAILLGGASFWLVVSAGQIKNINNRNVIVWVMGVLAIYVLFMAKIVLGW